jgi:hypothetical protein
LFSSRKFNLFLSPQHHPLPIPHPRPLIFTVSETDIAVDIGAGLFFVSFVVVVGWTLMQAGCPGLDATFWKVRNDKEQRKNGEDK